MENHRNCWNVSEDKDEERSQGKESVAEDVIRVDSGRELEEFLNSGPEEGVEVDRFLGSRDDPKTQYVLEMGTYVGAQVVVEKDEGPGSFRATLERSKAIG